MASGLAIGLGRDAIPLASSTRLRACPRSRLTTSVFVPLPSRRLRRLVRDHPPTPSVRSGGHETGSGTVSVQKRERGHRQIIKEKQFKKERFRERGKDMT